MISINNQREVVVGKHRTWYDMAGLKTDTKPTSSDIATGSYFVEVDTGDVYAYDESTTTWLKICALGGSGT